MKISVWPTLKPSIHTVTALDAAQKIGFPEARILIANVVIDLALSPNPTQPM